MVHLEVLIVIPTNYLFAIEVDYAEMLALLDFEGVAMSSGNDMCLPRTHVLRRRAHSLVEVHVPP